MKPLPKLRKQREENINFSPVTNNLHLEEADGLDPNPEPDVFISGMDRSVETKSKNLRKILFVCGALLFVVTTLILIYISKGLNPSAQVVQARITYGEVRLRQFGESIPVSAVLVPERTVYLDTVDGGRTIERHVEDGAYVTVGTPLITLRNKSLELDVINRESQYTQQLSSLAQAQIAFDQSMLRYEQQLMEARLQIDLTRADLDRRLPRSETGIAQSEIDRLRAKLTFEERNFKVISEARSRDSANAKKNLDQLKKSVARMEASIALVRESLDSLTLRAPIDGEVSSFTTEVGEVIAPGSRVAQIDETNAFKVRAKINEFYLGKLSIGQKAYTEINNDTYHLEVHKIYPTVENREFSADLRFLDVSPGHLRRGQGVQLSIALSEEGAYLTIPQGAYFNETGGQYVYVLSSDERSAIKRAVVLGRIGGNQVEVLEGLSEGEKIITSSYLTFNHRDRVNISDLTQ